jgi:hypothetical protein
MDQIRGQRPTVPRINRRDLPGGEALLRLPEHLRRPLHPPSRVRAIEELVDRRREAIEQGNTEERAKIEAKLYDYDPIRFSYLKLDERLRALVAGK